MARNYISPAMLPLESMAEYMEKVAGFRKKTDAANDTNNVDGVASNIIAIAATDKETGKLVKDRGTVQNSLELGGVPAKDYVTTEGANALLSDTYQVSINSGNETKNLRDELYQLKAELAKAGLIKSQACYNGFIDAFKEGDERFISEAITVTATDLSSNQIGSIIVEDATSFIAGEYIVIDTREPQIVQIQDVTGSDRINLTANVNGPIASNTKIYKSYGAYNNGMFV
ncbi:hypothetical protein, partial [Paraclostridium dentum]|uniref:hypothetical protein n=1 Tax=Paraclostridium dentum TaxID=2662455 RepID=UPI003F325778